MEKKEKKEKTGKFGKSVLWAVAGYAVISLIAGICSVLRGNIQGSDNTGISGFVVFEMILFPVLFYIAGYAGSKKCDFEKFKTYKIWLFSFAFSAVLLLLWYVLLDLYVLLNLPAAEGVRTIDLFLRKITVVQDYEVKYLSETDGYKYAMLPLIHFVLRIIYWLLYSLGNKKYAAAKKEAERKKARR